MINCINMVLVNRDDLIYSYEQMSKSNMKALDQEISQKSNEGYSLVDIGYFSNTLFWVKDDRYGEDELYMKNIAYLLHSLYLRGKILEPAMIQYKVDINNSQDAYDWVVSVTHKLINKYVITDIGLDTNIVTLELMCSDEDDYNNLFKIKDKFEEFMKMIHNYLYK